MKVCVKKELYSKKAVLVTVNWYLNHASVSVDATDTEYVVTINMHDGTDVDETEFMNKLVENEIKTIINNDTYSVREAIYNMKWAASEMGDRRC